MSNYMKKYGFRGGLGLYMNRGGGGGGGGGGSSRDSHIFPTVKKLSLQKSWVF